MEARNKDYAKIASHLHFHRVPGHQQQQNPSLPDAPDIDLGNDLRHGSAFGSGGQYQQRVLTHQLSHQLPQATTPEGSPRKVLLSSTRTGLGEFQHF